MLHRCHAGKVNDNTLPARIRGVDGKSYPAHRGTYDYDAIMALRVEGLSMSAIAAVIGCSSGTVARALRKHVGRQQTKGSNQ